MPNALTLHNALLTIAFAALLCLGWQAMVAVWGWITTGGPPPTAAILGAIVVVGAIILLRFY